MPLSGKEEARGTTKRFPEVHEVPNIERKERKASDTRHR
jgi:hypothetical protein